MNNKRKDINDKLLKSLTRFVISLFGVGISLFFLDSFKEISSLLAMILSYITSLGAIYFLLMSIFSFGILYIELIVAINIYKFKDTKKIKLHNKKPENFSKEAHDLLNNNRFKYTNNTKTEKLLNILQNINYIIVKNEQYKKELITIQDSIFNPTQQTTFLNLIDDKELYYAFICNSKYFNEVIETFEEIISSMKMYLANQESLKKAEIQFRLNNYMITLARNKKNKDK